MQHLFEKTLAFLFVLSASAMEEFLEPEKSTIHAITVPGQNGMGCRNYIDDGIISATIPWTRFKTPSEWKKIDLGQDNCIRHFQTELDALEKISPEVKSKQLLFGGCSQGTATLINWLALQPKEMQDRVKALVLESVLGSTDSAILHTTEHLISTRASYVPFARLVLPFIAKLNFPSYKPFGKQALTSAKQLPTDLPVIIMHDERDPQLSPVDPLLLYCCLKKRGNENVYLLRTDTGNHFSILSWDLKRDAKISALQKIYRKHGIPYNEKLLVKSSGSIEDLQPPVKAVEKLIYKRTRRPFWIRTIIDCVTILALFSFLSPKL